MSFPAHILALASQPSPQLVTTAWLNFVIPTIASPSSPEALDVVGPITRSIGSRLNADFEHRPLGRLLLSPQPDHMLFGYRGLSIAIQKAYDSSLIEGVAQIVRTHLSAGGTEGSLIQSAAVAVSSASMSTDKLEEIIWGFVRSRGRAQGWYSEYKITRNSMPAISDVVERHVDSASLNQLIRMVEFLDDVNQGALKFIPGYVDDFSPLRLRLVRRLLRDKDEIKPKYSDHDCNEDPLAGIYTSLLPWNLRGATSRNKMIRTLEKMERDLDPTQEPGPRGWTRFLPEFLRRFIG